MNKVIDPLPETRSDLAIFTDLAQRLGVQGYNDRSNPQWLKAFLDATPDFPDQETFKQIGVHRVEFKAPRVAFKDQIQDPKAYPFATPSGKIEIFRVMRFMPNTPCSWSARMPKPGSTPNLTTSPGSKKKPMIASG
jgi:anaerobic selenocysteine-containing dehydrogenase